MDGIRLQKLLSTAGVASRRAAEQLILEGRVMVNGNVVMTLGTRADPAKDDIRVDGRRLRFDARLRYLVLNKPKGYVTTRHDPEGRHTVMELVDTVREYIYPVGRLDYETDGLLLMTSDGDLAAQLTHPSHEVERVYEALVVGAPSDEALEKLRRGVYLDGRRTAPAVVRRTGTSGKGPKALTKLTITLHEGRNRQVRRMCASIGHPARRLTRVRMGPITLADLRPGQWRDLTPKELDKLKAVATKDAKGITKGAKESTKVTKDATKAAKKSPKVTKDTTKVAKGREGREGREGRQEPRENTEARKDEKRVHQEDS